ncbi:hypothetical protein L202_04528 [Cryptococcus amylolentus CBS 6039]|uniref:Uncharacterized protein n=1 Tax=Cryptococcus amylolentus CBS 6039 TaxID=1295533 RepID=A0A1E3HRM5_9TREE|nr:hypothetical protein L202_04528 [Cryptococcus amylolentus CBS 6039]ODN79023.1 hypothetical protein L202_04528 [Cryptococcus amylolentus CBS 6039]
MQNRAKQQVQSEKKKTIQSRINELTGEEPEYNFNKLRSTGIKVLRKRLQPLEEAQQSQYPLLNGSSNIGTTFEPEEEQQKGDTGMLDEGVGREHDPVWGKDEVDEALAWWSQSFGGTAVSWTGLQDDDFAMLQPQASVATNLDEFHWDLLNNEHYYPPT